MTKDYFRIEGNPQLNKESFTFSESSKYPYFTRTVFNNGIFGYVDYLDDAHLIKGNSLAVGMMACKFFYMSHDFYAGQFTKTAFPLFEGFNEQVALWFTTWFNKSSKKYLGVLVRNFEEEFYNTTLILPFNKDGKLAIKYIEERMRELEEERMRELEEERMRELEAYLTAAGFANCDLTPEEQVALRKFSNGEVKFTSYRIGDLFEIHPTKSYGETNSTLFAEQGTTPVVVNSSVNNGVGGWINRLATEKGNMLTYSDTTTSDAIFYQPFDFVGYSHVQGLYPKNRVWSENELLYFLSIFKKVAFGRFDYATKFTRQIASSLDTKLPVKVTGEIDYNIMETYISAIKKQIIQQLKDFIAKEHSTYQRVIEEK